MQSKLTCNSLLLVREKSFYLGDVHARLKFMPLPGSHVFEEGTLFTDRLRHFRFYCRGVSRCTTARSTWIFLTRSSVSSCTRTSGWSRSTSSMRRTKRTSASMSPSRFAACEADPRASRRTCNKHLRRAQQRRTCPEKGIVDTNLLASSM